MTLLDSCRFCLPKGCFIFLIENPSGWKACQSHSWPSALQLLAELAKLQLDDAAVAMSSCLRSLVLWP